METKLKQKEEELRKSIDELNRANQFVEEKKVSIYALQGQIQLLKELNKEKQDRIEKEEKEIIEGAKNE